MKILYLLPEYPPFFGGGISTFYNSLLPRLAKLGVEVTAVVGSGYAEGPHNVVFQDGVHVLPLNQSRCMKHNQGLGLLNQCFS